MANSTKKSRQTGSSTDAERALKRAAHDYTATAGMEKARVDDAFDRLKGAARNLVREEVKAHR